MVTFQLPSQLRELAGGRRCIAVDASTVGQAFTALDAAAPMLGPQIFDTSGRIRQFVGVFVDQRQIAELGDGSLPLHDGSRIVIVMAVAGG